MTTVLRLHALYIASISTDITYDNVGAATWSAIELNVGIMCACFPALRPVISLFSPRLSWTTRREHSSNYPRRTYEQGESVTELSQVNRPRSEAGKDDAISFDHGNDANATRVKTEWVVTEGERV